jgi:alpha-tubulin suppressor-like RCC1 family protein
MLVAALAVLLVPAAAAGEQASDPASPAAGRLDVGENFSCAIVTGGQVRCWGYGADGELGYPGVTSVGLTDTPASVGPVDLGAGYTATALSVGDYHTCAIRNDGSLVCWGFGADGRLGYGSESNVGDKATAGSAGAVNLGPGRTAVAITAGAAHTCAILDNGQVECWGYGFNGQLGYGNPANVGDTSTDTPGLVGPVNLGTGRTAVAISAAIAHTCAILDNGQVECWGYGGNGRLGYGDTAITGNSPGTTPGAVGAVNLGGHKAVAISAGGIHTCVILDDGSVRCWGFGFNGELGYGSQSDAGDSPTDTPNLLPPVNLGPGRTAVAISAGASHTCAILDNGQVECWGYGADGRLGDGSTADVGDTPADTPGLVGPVNLGAGRTAVAISAGGMSTCAGLDDGSVRCWGSGSNGLLGYCNGANVGDTPADTPFTAGPVNLVPGDGGEQCAAGGPAPPAAPGGTTSPSPTPSPKRPVTTAAPDDAARARRFRSCLRAATAAASGLRAATRHGTPRRRAGARRRLQRRLAAGRARCVKKWGRTPGRVTGLSAAARGSHAIELRFTAPGTDGDHPPAVTGYLVKESAAPIGSRAEFDRAPSLCKGDCRFTVTKIGTEITLTVTSLNPGTVYYYAVAALDNVTGRPGPRAGPVRVKTRA